MKAIVIIIIIFTRLCHVTLLWINTPKKFFLFGVIYVRSVKIYVSISFFAKREYFSFDIINIALFFQNLAMPFSKHHLFVLIALLDRCSLKNFVSLPRTLIVESSANNEV